MQFAGILESLSTNSPFPRYSLGSPEYIGHGAFPENGGTPGVSPSCYEISCAPVATCCRSRQDSPLPPLCSSYLYSTKG